MNYYKIKIQYEGTHYAGFQWQNNVPTIQSALNNALAQIFNKKFSTTAASRTDTGVHALEQIVKITSEESIDLLTFLPELNNILPREIRCINIENCESLFRPAVEAKAKEYRYLFTNKILQSNNASGFISNIANELDLKKINLCIEYLKGVHDFCNFYSAGSNVKSTVRNIFVCELKEINPHDFFSESELFQIPQELNQCYEIRIMANGFLKQMIRHIVSALWMVGTNKISVDDFLSHLNGPKLERQHWKVAPANGLYLYKITY